MRCLFLDALVLLHAVLVPGWRDFKGFLMRIYVASGLRDDNEIERIGHEGKPNWGETGCTEKIGK